MFCPFKASCKHEVLGQWCWQSIHVCLSSGTTGALQISVSLEKDGAPADIFNFKAQWLENPKDDNIIVSRVLSPMEGVINAERTPMTLQITMHCVKGSSPYLLGVRPSVLPWKLSPGPFLPLSPDLVLKIHCGIFLSQL